MPKITVFTPTYNRADLIRETIETVLAQSFKDFEYLIIDDGSTDNTEEIVRPYLVDKRVKYIKRKNAGEAETANYAWSVAKGEYFTQVNSDDPILPGLFWEMVKVLDKKQNVVVAYPGFYFIDVNGKIIKKEKNEDWNFIKDLSIFSCYAASAGTFIRKSSFKDWEKIKDSRFKYISDIEMYWKMALVGDFYHVPKFLANWRDHNGGISTDRWKSIPEIEIWFKEYFSQNNLPAEVLGVKTVLRKNLYKYFIYLLKNSNSDEEESLMKLYKKKLGYQIYDFKNLQVGDNDLIGNKFNGHDLHKYLREKNIDSSHLVWNKESDDENTYWIAGEKQDRESIKQNAVKIQAQYSLDCTPNAIFYDILYNRLFLTADIVHLHLIHNYIFDIQLLPIMSRLKPIVWTIHDPWPTSGHCIQNFECEKWRTGCGDCPHLNEPFVFEKDNTALNYELKKTAILNSKIDVVVASEYMKERLNNSDMFKNAIIHVIPFGVNHEIFKPVDKKSVRSKLGIPENAFVISFRGDNNYKKGLDYIAYTINKIKTDKKIYFLVFGGKYEDKNKKYNFLEYGWIKDDQLMADIYNASDLFLMPSVVESFGMMAIEAMSCGVLPIVLEGTALPDVVNAPKCGVAAKKDKEDYLKTVQYYIDNDTQRIDRSQKCLEFARENYDKIIYVEKIIALYKDVIKRHHITPADRFVLDQLKKNMATKPQLTKLSEPEDSPKSNFKDNILFYFYKIYKRLPKNIRQAFKKTASKYKFFKRYLAFLD